MQYIGPIIAALAAAIASISGYRAAQLKRDVFADEQYKHIIRTLQAENKALRRRIEALESREAARTQRENRGTV